MNCIQTQTLLDAYADHELGRIAAFRVRRHLAGCADCAAQLADIQHLNTSVHAWRDVAAPAGLASQTAVAMPPVASPTARHRFPVRPAAVGLAGVAAVIAAVFWSLPGQPGQPTIAFADVEQAMAQVQAVSWDETWEFYGPVGHPVKNGTSQTTHWLRRNPPALASVEHLHGRFQDLADERGELIRLAPSVYAVFKPHPGRGAAAKTIGEETEETLRQFTLPQTAPPTPPANMSGQLTSRTRFLPTTQRRVTLNGQERILFRRVKEVTLTDPRGGKRHLLFQLRLWADPKTYRVVRSESRDTQREDPEGWDVITLSGFHYDQPAPPSVFDWSPPLGAKVLIGAKAFDAMLFFARHSLLSPPVSGRRAGRTRGH